MPTYTGNISGSDVRDLTGISTTIASDEVIGKLLPIAASQLNNDIQIRYEDWRVHTIDSYRENKVDGSNTTFYVPQDKRPIGDYNDVGIISGGAVKAYVTRNDGGSSARNRVPIIVETIDDAFQGKITLTSAPSQSDTLFLTWSFSPLDLVQPHPLIRKAISHLVASIASTRVDASKVSKFKVGKVTVTGQSEGASKHMANYDRAKFQILSKIVKRRDFPLLFRHGHETGHTPVADGHFDANHSHIHLGGVTVPLDR